MYLKNLKHHFLLTFKIYIETQKKKKKEGKSERRRKGGINEPNLGEIFIGKV